MRDVLRAKVQSDLRAAGIDVYIAVTPTNFRYLSGYNSAFLDLSWQMTGTDMVVLPADCNLSPAIVVSEYCAPDARRLSDIKDIRCYSMWTENRNYRTIASPASDIVPRPMQYDSVAIFDLVRQIIEERGLGDGVIGTDLALMKHATHQALTAAFPGAKFVDCERILYRARRRKHPEEIGHLRNAARLFDVGVQHVFDVLHPGQTLNELRLGFEGAVKDAVAADPAMGALEKTFFFPHVGTGDGHVVREGDVVKLDCGVRIEGYWSDGCRHATLGPASTEQRLIHQALLAGFTAGRALLMPGQRMSEVYDAVLTAVRQNGLPAYSRGHFGHSIGMDDQTEEPPFLGPDPTRLEPGMVICLEVPFYPPDQGGFNLEDMFLINDNGVEPLTHASLEMREIH